MATIYSRGEIFFLWALEWIILIISIIGVIIVINAVIIGIKSSFKVYFSKSHTTHRQISEARISF